MRASQLHVIGAAVLVLASSGLAWYGQPDPVRKWTFLAPELEPRLIERQVQIDPVELLGLMHNDYLDLQIIDVRDERDWNLFHLWGAERIPVDELASHRQRFATLAANGVIVFVSNDETLATQAWKLVMASASQPNAYILAGGINRWLDAFARGGRGGRKVDEGMADETLRHPIKWALGSRHPAALPDLHQVGTGEPPRRRVRLRKRVVQRGGCG